MKKLFFVSLIIIQSCVVLAQNCCVNDSTIREIQFPLTEHDTETVFVYLNNEWVALPYLDMVPADSIQKMEVKNDEYDNRAIFLTVSPETVAAVKGEMKKLFINFDPRCEFPGGNGKLKEWIDANIRVPDGYKGCERVMVRFTVLPDGSIRNPQIIKPSKNESANEEALRLVNELPNFRVKYFTPRKSNINLCLPITFREPGVLLIRGDEQLQRVLYEPESSPLYLNGGSVGLLSDFYTILEKTAPVAQDCVNGVALISFKILKDGSIDPNSIKIIRNRSIPEDYMNAAIGAIKKLGKFEPGKINGSPLNVTYNLPVKYPVPLEYIKTSE